MSVSAINMVGVPFRGSGSESTGSAAYLNAVTVPEQEPDTVEISNQNNPNFQGNDFAYSEKQNTGKKPFAIIALTAIGAAAAIAGMGAVGRAMHRGSISNETIKNFLNKKFPKSVTDKCYEWCSSVKGYGIKGKTWVTDTAWPAIKNFFCREKK